MPSGNAALMDVSTLTVPREVSKKRHIYDVLLSRIKDRSLPVGTRLPSASVLATEWQVAYATAHAALNELTRAGWLVRHPRQGTFVADPPKRRDLSLFAKTISVALPPREDIVSVGYGNEVFEMLQGLTEGAREVGQQIRIEPLPSSPTEVELEQAFESMMMSDFSIFVGFQYKTLIKRLAAEGRAVTTLISDPGAGNIVTYDRAASMQMAMDHLASGGYRKIAFIGNAHDVGGKYNAYREAVEERGLEWNSELTFHCTGVKACREQVRRFLDLRPDCDAVLIPNYQIASAFQREALIRNLKLPEDMALIAQGIAGQELGDPQITYVRVPYLEIGIEAMRAISQADKSGGVRKILLQPQLIQGVTT